MTQPQPVITIAVSDALARIEAKVDSISNQLVGKADAATVHELESRVRVLETTQATHEAVGKAISRSRGAFWAAVAAGGGAIGSAAYVLSQIHH